MNPPPDDPQQYAAYPRAFGRSILPRRVRFEAIADAWRPIKANFAVWLAAMLVLVLIYLAMLAPYVVLVFQAAINNPKADPTEFQSKFGTVMLATQFVLYLVVGIANAGILHMGVLAVRGQPVTVGDIFRLNGQFGKVIVAEGILALVAGAGAAAAMAPRWLMPDADLITVSLVMNMVQIVVYGILAVVHIFTTFVPMLIVDKQVSVGEAFRLSAQAARSNFWILLAVLLVVSLLGGAGVLLCGIGVLFTYMFYYATRAVMYNDVFGPEPEAYAAPFGDFSAPPPPTSL